MVGPDAAGYLTVWDCAATQPTVSTVNFTAGETAPNLASIPLDANGGLCVIANTGTDLVIDVNGYFGASGSSRYTPVTPARLMDTRDGTGGSGRLAAGDTVTLQVGGVAGVPAGVQAVSLNVTSVDPGAAGYVTVYACGGQRPVVSNLNPQPGRVRPNLVVVPVSADGKVCLFSLQDVELVVGHHATEIVVRLGQRAIGIELIAKCRTRKPGNHRLSPAVLECRRNHLGAERFVVGQYCFEKRPRIVRHRIVPGIGEDRAQIPRPRFQRNPGLRQIARRRDDQRLRIRPRQIEQLLDRFL